MRVFKKVCLLSLFLLPTVITSSYVVDSAEQDIVRRYQQEVLKNARYNNYKDSRKKFLESDIESLRLEIDDCNYRINNFRNNVNDLDYKLDSLKAKRTELDGQLAQLMCLDDFGDSTAQSRMLKLQKDISLNEDMIRSYESQQNSYNLKINDLNSKRVGLERRLRDRQRELNRL